MAFARAFACGTAPNTPEGTLLRAFDQIVDDDGTTGPRFYGEIVKLSDGSQWLLGSPSPDDESALAERIATTAKLPVRLLTLALDLIALDALEGDEETAAEALADHVWQAAWFDLGADGSRGVVPASDAVSDFHLHGDEAETLHAELWRRMPEGEPVERIAVSGRLRGTPARRICRPDFAKSARWSPAPEAARWSR